LSDVTECEPDPGSLVATIYDEPDYRDRFCVSVRPGQYGRVDQVASDWFTKQPAWIRLLSTNTVSTGGIETAIRQGGYGVGTRVGSWEVVQRNDNEIVFGHNMGFMEYRFSLRLLEQSLLVEGSTAVKFLWPRTGRYYFALVRPIHRRFVKLLLVKATSEM
jgi:hypothetical protein